MKKYLYTIYLAFTIIVSIIPAWLVADLLMKLPFMGTITEQDKVLTFGLHSIFFLVMEGIGIIILLLLAILVLTIFTKKKTPIQTDGPETPIK